MEAARRFAARLAGIDGVVLDPVRVQSNIVRFEVKADAGELASLCHARGVHMLPGGAHGMRAVLHRDVTPAEADEALEIVAAVLEELRVPSAEPPG